MLERGMRLEGGYHGYPPRHIKSSTTALRPTVTITAVVTARVVDGRRPPRRVGLQPMVIAPGSALTLSMTQGGLLRLQNYAIFRQVSDTDCSYAQHVPA